MMAKLTESRIARFVAAKEWPDVQRQKKYADGAYWFSCAGHGGTVVMLDRFSEHAKAVLRKHGLVAKVVHANGRLYYSGEYKLEDHAGIEVAIGEEDCGWAVLFVAKKALSDGYDAYGKAKGFLDADYDGYAEAVSSAKNWSPDEYEDLTGETVAVEESYIGRKRKFEKENAENFVTSAAYGSWHKAVPEGKVGVYAERKADGGKAYFLVGADEYEAREGSFVIDLDRHERVAAL
jgi:hypothetical protein